jgi:hypothetical protein
MGICKIVQKVVLLIFSARWGWGGVTGWIRTMGGLLSILYFGQGPLLEVGTLANNSWKQLEMSTHPTHLQYYSSYSFLVILQPDDD